MYWDTSALLKLYVDESDSSAYWELLLASKRCVYTSTLARAETLCALVRKHHCGDLDSSGVGALLKRFRDDIGGGRIVLVGVSEEVHSAVERLAAILGHGPIPMLRTLDMIHLGSAVASRSKEIVVADHRLRLAAASAGLRVLPVK
jgi:predicted nucleic acid-binding protein